MNTKLVRPLVTLFPFKIHPFLKMFSHIKDYNLNVNIIYLDCTNINNNNFTKPISLHLCDDYKYIIYDPAGKHNLLIYLHTQPAKSIMKNCLDMFAGL